MDLYSIPNPQRTDWTVRGYPIETDVIYWLVSWPKKLESTADHFNKELLGVDREKISLLETRHFMLLSPLIDTRQAD
ncbi:hypothetical protein RRG08_008796 [Elysia crispata]|uniref:Uncharacterized protein n=1 Tax=Elysia crispata TaxID=231223 RepID=A0AAE0Z7J4_9GAST|nr:hypothetical protein RRG08_008796 [Elysia crispata]